MNAPMFQFLIWFSFGAGRNENFRNEAINDKWSMINGRL